MAPTTFGIWVVEAKVGEGSFGDVYRCRDPFLKKLLAVKALKGNLPGDAATVADFFKEAELLAHFNHPVFTHIHYLNPDPPWIAMEFLEGETLEAVLRRKEPLSLERIAAIFHAVCDGLHHIHEQVEERYRTIHRDLKPSNVLLTRDGRVKVIDFGVAKAQIGDPTIVGIVKGTPLYMSPEHMAGTVDHRSDLWSLAVILFEALTGTRPYPDPDPGQAWSYAKLRRFEHAVLNERYAALPAEMPEAVSRALVPFFDQAFQVEKEKRFQGALKFRSALDRVVDQIAREIEPAELVFPPLSKADTLLMEAGEAFDHGDHDAARELYEKVLRLDPNNEEAHHWLLQIEDRVREAAAKESAAEAAHRDRLKPAVERLGRILGRPAIGLPAEAIRAAREVVSRFEQASAEDLAAVEIELGTATLAVQEGLVSLLEQGAKDAREAVDRLRGIDEAQASVKRKELDRLAAAGASDPSATVASLAALREIARRAREEIDDARGRLLDQSAGVASHLELLLAAHQGDPARFPQALADGRRALEALGNASATSEPAILRAGLLAAAGAVDSLVEKAGIARLDTLRQAVARSSASVKEALPDSLATPWGLREDRDRALRAAAEAMPAGNAAQLASISASMQGLVETIDRIGPALRVPPQEAGTSPPAVLDAPSPTAASLSEATPAAPQKAGAPAPSSPGMGPSRRESVGSPPPAPRSRTGSAGTAPASPVAAPGEKPGALPAGAPADARPARAEAGPAARQRMRPAEHERGKRAIERGPHETTIPARGPMLKWALLATAALATVVVLVLIFRPKPQSEQSPPPIAPTEGALFVEALPWGHVKQILDLDSSKPVAVPAGMTTPARISLPPGNYRITVAHPDFGQVSIDAEVRLGEVRDVALQLPKFDVEKLLEDF